MRAMQVQEFGGPEVIQQVEAPEPVAGSGQAVVEVGAANVLFFDTLVRSGWAKDFAPVVPPYVPGSGVAGRVVSVGPDVDSSWIGTEVVAETGTDMAIEGGYAERAAVPAEKLFAVPAGLESRKALAVLTDGPTALQLAEAARFTPDQWVLVAAATGGAGSLLVQLARGAGARVIAAARGERKLQLARELGAEAAVDYSQPGWVDRVRELTGGGAQAVLDGAGGPLGTAAFGATADGGRFISYGTAEGFSEVDQEQAKRRGVTALSLFDLPYLDTAGDKRLADQAIADTAEGRLRPVVGEVLPLAEAAKAHAALEAREVLGKVLLVP